MKRTAITLAGLLALSTTATQAQNVTLYGLVDTGVERLDHVGAGSDSVFRMPTLAGSFASRWGMRGSEDLGNGLKAVFTLESGFAADSGIPQQAGRLFGRQAYVGLQGGWGTLSFGRQYSMLFHASLNADLMLAQIYGAGAFDPFLAGPRVDNAVSYLGKWGGLSAGATYSFGRDNPGAGGCPGEVAGDSQNCRQWSAMVKYDTPNWGVAAWTDDQNNAAGLSDTRSAVNGYLMLGSTKLSASYMRRDNEPVAAATPTLDESRLASVALLHPLTPAITLEAQYYDFDYDDSDNDARMLVLRGSYAFSKRTVAYVTSGLMRNQGASALSASVASPAYAPTPGRNQTGVMVGLRHSF